MASPENKNCPRPTPEGVALGLAISQLALPTLAVQAGLAAAIHESLQSLPPATFAELSILFFGASLVVGGLYEMDTLRHSGVVVNPATTFLHLHLHHPELAVLFGNIYGFISSPSDLASLVGSYVLADSGRIVFSNLMARSVVGLSFSLAVNWAIRQGYAKPVLEKMENYHVKIIDRLNQIETSLIPLPDRVDYLDNTSGDFHAWVPR